MWYLEDKKLIAPQQGGFREKRNAIDQVTVFMQAVADGFQKRNSYRPEESTLAVFLDLKQSYDKVWRQGLLLKLQRLGVNSNMYAWIKNVLTSRTVQTRFGKHTPRKLALEQGLPQGSALSCTLFFFGIHKRPTTFTIVSLSTLRGR